MTKVEISDSLWIKAQKPINERWTAEKHNCSKELFKHRKQCFRSWNLISSFPFRNYGYECFIQFSISANLQENAKISIITLCTEQISAY